MHNLARLVRRIKRFPISQVATASGLSRRNLYAIINGEVTNPTLSTLTKLERAITRLEAAAAKTKSIQKTAKKQTVARDSGAGAVAGKRS